MNLIILLRFLVENCAQLFEVHGFTIVHSEVGPTHVAGASITLESKDVQIFFVIECDELLMSFRSLHEKEKVWYSDLNIFRLLGRKGSEKLLNNKSDAAFLAKNWDKIIHLFDKECLAETLVTLKKFNSETYAGWGFKL